MKFECPSCGEEVKEMKPEWLVKKCLCSGCGKSFWPILNLLSEEATLLQRIEAWMDRKHESGKAEETLAQVDSSGYFFGMLAILFLIFGLFIPLLLPLSAIMGLVAFVMWGISSLNGSGPVVNTDAVLKDAERMHEIDSLLNEIDIDGLTAFLNENPAANFLYQSCTEKWLALKHELTKTGFSFS